MISISDKEFSQFQSFIYEAAGITLSDAKKPLVSGRLSKRLQHCKLGSFGEYFRLLSTGTVPAEVQIAVDLLTTNETYFFREQKHFDFLRAQAIAARRRPDPFRVWSAACSSGEEAYSIAMVLADSIVDDRWEAFGSDISTRVLEAARSGHYPIERTKFIPHPYLQRFCLRGVDDQSGSLLVDRNLRSRVRFLQANLNMLPPKIDMFDVIFLRNVMIYFNDETKRRVVRNVLSLLKPGGHFFVGHSENLHTITDVVKAVAPAIYVKPA